jgi:hypothetical protein
MGLGSDFLLSHRSILDYRNRRLCLHDSALYARRLLDGSWGVKSVSGIEGDVLSGMPNTTVRCIALGDQIIISVGQDGHSSHFAARVYPLVEDANKGQSSGIIRLSRPGAITVMGHYRVKGNQLVLQLPR